MKTGSVIMGFLALGVAVALMPAKAQAYDGYCREYNRTVTIGNRQEVAYGTACYQPDGSWKIVDEDDRSRIGQRFHDQDVSDEGGYQPAYNRPVYQPVYQVYHYRPQTSRIVFISDNDHRHKHHYKSHHKKHHGKRPHDRHHRH